MNLIDSTKELEELCARLTKSEFVTVDTEFIRDKTYWPRLCLIQIAGDDDIAAIDVLAKGIDLSAFFKLMQNKKVLKVFHAARQDIEIFYHLTGKIPGPVFDTQIAAMVCGFGDQVSYEKLTKAITGETIDKTSRYTDWAQRPLSKKQLSYALADVDYLREIYRKIRERIQKFDRISWLDEEHNIITAKATYDNPPEDAWQRIKIHKTKPRTLAILQQIAAWRETRAQKIDIPRNRVIRDDVLAQIAVHPPSSREKLAKIRGVSDDFAKGEHGTALLEAIQKGLDMPDKKCPQKQKKPQMPTGLGPTIDLLRVLMKQKCEEHMVAPKLLASARDLELIAADDKADIPALKGWRYDIFGKDALALKKGKLALSIEKQEIKIVRQ